MPTSPEYIIDKISQAGVVGAGGAGFPTHAKLGQPVEQVIANGAECEPLLASDITLLEHQSPQIIQGLLLIMEATRAKQGIIALKAKHSSLINILHNNIEPYPRLKIQLLDDFYPAGDEHTLIQEVTGKRVAPGQFPPSVGVVVNNVTTLWQVFSAFSGQPVTSRYVTVTGDVHRPIVIDTPIGTPLSELVEAAGGSPLDEYRIIVGGPMMGRLATDPEQEFSTKTTSGIIIVSAQHWLVQRNRTSPSQQLRRVQSACDNCRMCTDLCPRYLLGHPLEPHATMQALSQQQINASQHFISAMLCCQCGICDTVACPCNLSPRALYQELRKEFAHQKLSPQKFDARPVAPERKGRRTPLHRIKQRLDLHQFDGEKPILAGALVPNRVRIKLRQHVGAAAVPVVRVGDLVKKGQLVGDVPEGKLGARVHASIGGVVMHVGKDFIEITRS